MCFYKKNSQIFSDLSIQISLSDIESKIKVSKESSELNRITRSIYDNFYGCWKPVILFQWFEFDIEQKTKLGRIHHPDKGIVQVDLGESTEFLVQATHVLVAVYSIGERLDIEYAKLVSEGKMLEAYITDLLGLSVLEKTGDLVKQTAEKQAKKMGWGAGSFLSPGSVHGWDLEEQSKLCQLLPLNQVPIKINSNAVLTPLKSIVSLIGIGPGYKTTKVGSTCDVCSKRETCQMNKLEQDVPI